MPKFQRVTCEIDAVCYDGNNQQEIIDLISPYTKALAQSYPARNFLIATTWGVCGLFPGDWVILDASKTVSVLKEKMFKREYEPKTTKFMDAFVRGGLNPDAHDKVHG